MRSCLVLCHGYYRAVEFPFPFPSSSRCTRECSSLSLSSFLLPPLPSCDCFAVVSRWLIAWRSSAVVCFFSVCVFSPSLLPLQSLCRQSHSPAHVGVFIRVVYVAPTRICPIFVLTTHHASVFFFSFLGSLLPPGRCVVRISHRCCLVCPCGSVVTIAPRYLIPHCAVCRSVSSSSPLYVNVCVLFSAPFVGVCLTICCRSLLSM